MVTAKYIKAFLLGRTYGTRDNNYIKVEYENYRITAEARDV